MNATTIDPHLNCRSSSELPGPAACGWHAELQLGFERRGDRTILASERHVGPLMVQKILYPEGDDPCHAIVLHPPGGVAGGDRLKLEVHVTAAAQVLVTTTGATRWYRSRGSPAVSATHLKVGPAAVVEYLPREAIAFDGSKACAELEMDLAVDARVLGWDVWCLGRTASGEAFTSGRLELATRLRCNGRLRWEERGQFDGGSPLLRAGAGFAGHPVFGTLWAAGAGDVRELVAACRAAPPPGEGSGAVTQLPGVVLARYLGPSTEHALAWFTSLWRVLRPIHVGRAAVPPRIWSV